MTAAEWLAAPQCGRGRLAFLCFCILGKPSGGSMHVHAPTRLVSMPVGFYGVNVQRSSSRVSRRFGASRYAANHRAHCPMPVRRNLRICALQWAQRCTATDSGRRCPGRACVALRLLLAGSVGGVRPGQRNNLKRNGGAALAQHANIDGSLTRDINDVAGRGSTVCYLHHH